MKIEAAELNANGIKISKRLLEDAIKKYKARYYDMCYVLYDNYWQSTPSEFCASDVKRAFMQEFPDVFKYLISRKDATVDWSSKRIRYALAMCNHRNVSRNALDLLDYLRILLESKEALDSLNNIYERGKFGVKGRKNVTFSPKINLSTHVADNSKFKFDNPAIHEAISISADSVLIRVDTRKIMRNKAMSMLGATEQNIKTMEESGKGFFSAVLTQEEELDFLDYFLQGVVKARGTAADLLNERLESEAQYSMTNSGGITVLETFAERAFIESLNERCDFVREQRAELEKKYSVVKPFYVDNDGVLFEVSRGNAADTDYDEKFEVPKRFVGSFAIDYCKSMMLPSYCMLSGNFGELISKDDVLDNGYYTEAKPVKIDMLFKSGNNVKKRSMLYYNIADVYYSDERNEMGELATNTLRPKIGDTLSLDYESEQSLFDNYNVTSRLGLYRTIRSKLARSVFNIPDEKKQGYFDLVADLVCAFKYFDCCGKTYECVNSCYDYVTESEFDMACYDADCLVSQGNI